MALIPDQHVIKTFPAQSSYEALDMGRCVWGSVRRWYPSDVHDLKEPRVKSGTTRDYPSILLKPDRMSKLTVFSVIVMD